MVPKLGLVDTAPPTDRRYWGYTALSAADVVTVCTYLLDRAPASFRDFTLSPSTTSSAARSDTVTALTRQVHDQAAAPSAGSYDGS